MKAKSLLFPKLPRLAKAAPSRHPAPLTLVSHLAHDYWITIVLCHPVLKRRTCKMSTDIRTSELKSPIDVAEYLFRRLHEVGVRGVHGVPGDYNLVRCF